MAATTEQDIQTPPAPSKSTLHLLQRATSGQVRFSDVYPELAGLDDPEWWRKTDFDAGLTDEVESSGFPKAKQVPIGYRPWLAEYGLVLLDDLIHSNRARANSYRSPLQLHPDIMKEQKDSHKAVVALANYAPRDDDNTKRGQNGSDFYLAITNSGLEVYTTPLRFLQGLNARNRIVALYRIPTAGHPEFDGDHEQFRSARVTRTRRHPMHLVPEFEYKDTDELLRARKDGSHPEIVPEDPRPGKIAFIDKFGNVKLDLAADEFAKFQKVRTGSSAVLVVKSGGNEIEVPVRKARDLRGAPLGKLAVYSNCSDQHDDRSSRHFAELAARVNGNPSTSTETAAYQLYEKAGDLDVENAEISIQV